MTYQERHDAVMGIDLNNVHRSEVDAAQYFVRKTDELVGSAYWAFLHFFHMDSANAAMHRAAVRFSPITFRLAEALEGTDFAEVDTGELAEVLAHRGRYAEDPGR